MSLVVPHVRLYTDQLSISGQVEEKRRRAITYERSAPIDERAAPGLEIRTPTPQLVHAICGHHFALVDVGDAFRSRQQ